MLLGFALLESAMPAVQHAVRLSMQYIAFIRANPESTISSEEWGRFIRTASEAGVFKGGSELGQRHALGDAAVPDSTNTIDGFMRFDSDDLAQLLALLESHPCLLHGGTIELREMPQTG